jgi:hypothetical protein
MYIYIYVNISIYVNLCRIEFGQSSQVRYEDLMKHTGNTGKNSTSDPHSSDSSTYRKYAPDNISAQYNPNPLQEINSTYLKYENSEESPPIKQYTLPFSSSSRNKGFMSSRTSSYPIRDAFQNNSIDSNSPAAVGVLPMNRKVRFSEG